MKGSDMKARPGPSYARGIRKTSIDEIRIPACAQIWGG